MPQVAVPEDLADDIALASFDEGDDLHGPAALGAEQRVGLVDAFDEHGPAAAIVVLAIRAKRAARRDSPKSESGSS